MNCMSDEDKERRSSCEHAEFFRYPGELKFINTTWVLLDSLNGVDELPAWCPLKLHCSCLEFELFLSARVNTVSTCITCVTQILTDPNKTDEGRACSKLFYQRTMNQAINISSFVFQVTRTKRSVAHSCMKTPEAPFCQ